MQLKGLTKWMKEQYGEEFVQTCQDIAEHGVDGGIGGLIYYDECEELYNRFEEEIYEYLNEEAEQQGFDSVDALVATFNRKDLLATPQQRKTLLLWASTEHVARLVSDKVYEQEQENDDEPSL